MFDFVAVPIVGIASAGIGAAIVNGAASLGAKLAAGRKLVGEFFGTFGANVLSLFVDRQRVIRRMGATGIGRGPAFVGWPLTLIHLCHRAYIQLVRPTECAQISSNHRFALWRNQLERLGNFGPNFGWLLRAPLGKAQLLAPFGRLDAAPEVIRKALDGLRTML